MRHHLLPHRLAVAWVSHVPSSKSLQCMIDKENAPCMGVQHQKETSMGIQGLQLETACAACTRVGSATLQAHA